MILETYKGFQICTEKGEFVLICDGVKIDCSDAENIEQARGQVDELYGEKLKEEEREEFEAFQRELWREYNAKEERFESLRKYGN